MKSDREITKKKTIKNIECENHLLDLRDEEIRTFSLSWVWLCHDQDTMLSNSTFHTIESICLVILRWIYTSCVVSATSLASSSTTDEQTTAIMNSEPSKESPKTNEATSAETFKPTDSVTEPGGDHASKDNSGTKNVLIIAAVTASLIAVAISVTVLVVFLCRKR